MAESVGSLYYEIDLDDKKLRGSLDSSDKLVKGFGDRVSQHWGNAVDASRKFSMAITGLAVATGGFISKATLTAARTETLGVAMNAVSKATGTSTDVLREQEKILKKQGITTQEARRTLTLFMQSQLDVAQASKIARVAQDLAVISGENSSVTTARLTEAIATMNPMLLRQVGIVKNSEEIFDTYGKTIGKTGRDLTETEKKQALLNLILKEGEKVAGTYEASMGTAGKKLGSLSRHVEEAFNTIGNFFLPAFGRAIDATTAFFKAIQKDNLEKWLRMIKENTWVVAVIAGAILGALVPAIVAATGAFVVFLLTLAPWALLGAAMVLALKALGISFGDVKTALGFVTDAFNIVKAIVVSLTDTFMAHFWPSIKALAAAFIENLLPALKQMWDAITRLWNAIQPAFVEILKVLGIIIGAILVAAVWLFINVFRIAIEVLGFVIGVIGNVINWISNLINWLGTAAVAVVGAVGSIREWFNRLPGIVRNAISSIPGQFSNMISGVINTVWGFYGRFVDAGWGLIRALANGIRGAAGEAINAVKSVLNRLRNLLPFSDAKEGPLRDLTLSGRRFSETFAKGIINGSQAITDAIRSTMATPGFNIAGNINAPALGMLNAGSASAGSTINNNAGVTVNIGNIEDRQDADYILRRMDQNQILEGRGLSPAI